MAILAILITINIMIYTSGLSNVFRTAVVFLNCMFSKWQCIKSSTTVT